MADTKVSDLTADASPSGDDLLYVVNDPGGTPGGRKVTIANLEASLAVANMSDAADFATVADLASTSNGDGASTIGIEDAGTLITATTVEGALAELAANIDTIEAAGYITATLTQEQVEDYVGGMLTGNTETLITVTYQDADGTIDFVVDNDLANYSNANSGFAVAATLASTSNGDGAALIGIEDSGGLITATTVEGALAENRTAIDALEAAGYITDVTGDNLSALADVTITTIASGEVLKWNGTAWVNNTLAEAGIAASSHNHNASDINAGTLTHERGGLEADVSAYSGLVKISAGATSAVTDNSTNWNTAFGWGDHGSAGYVANTTQVIAGDGLSDGGALSGNVTLNVDIAGQTENVSPGSTDWVLVENNAGGTFRKVQLTNLPGGGGGDAWSDAVDSDIVPTGADSTYDIGTTTDRFAEGWFDDLTAGNSVSAGDGSVTAPGFKFAGDTNNGLYRIGADNWALAVGSIKALELLDTGSGNAVFYWEVASGITASATQTQGQQPLLSSYNEISTVTTTNDVVTLRTAAAGLKQTVVNNGANTLQIFPASGDDLGAGVDTSTTLAAGDSITFFAIDATNWATIAVNTGAALVSGDIGSTVQGYDADTLKADVGDTLTAGFLSDSYSGGTISSGTYTPAPATGQENFQHYTNNGAHTLAPPSSPCSVVIEITNGASAGAITTSGFTAVDGDAFDTGNGNVFIAYITKTNGSSYLSVKAL